MAISYTTSLVILSRAKDPSCGKTSKIPWVLRTAQDDGRRTHWRKAPGGVLLLCKYSRRKTCRVFFAALRYNVRTGLPNHMTPTPAVDAETVAGLRDLNPEDPNFLRELIDMFV